TWAWLGRKAVHGSSFTYAFPDEADAVRFCFAMPYFEADLRRFLDRYEGNPHLRVETLCQTAKGRTVRRLHVGALDGEPDHRLLVTCRHHCCECMASYAVEGLIETILADEDDGAWLRKHVELLAVPFMDKDGVEDGDQGKNRKPHDHNRDYGKQCIYPSVKAIRALVPQWSDGRLHVALDLHCPHIRGPHNEVIYQVGSATPAIWEQQQAFGKILERVAEGPLPYHARNNLPFGTAWNTQRNYRGGKSCSRWTSEQPGIWLASSFEIPYANASGKPVTADSARAFGRDLATALRRYLEQHESEEARP
ncbi:MAG: peptidase M14, partial [Planctomycetota bacterium]